MNVTHGLRRALQINGNGIATVCGDRRRTWSEVGERVSRFAGALQNLGVRADDRVAALMLNSDRYLELYLAVAWAGAVIVPLNTRWSVAENEAAVRDCAPKVLVVDATFLAAAQEIRDAVGQGLMLVYADDGECPQEVARYETLIEASPVVPDAMRRPEELAGIFYTGGTTGRSKGVMLSHRNLMSDARNALAEGITRGNATYLHAAPMFHLANGAAMYANLLGGGRNVMIKAFSPQAVLDVIEKERVTEILLVPTMIQMLVDHPVAPGADRDISSLKRIEYGASPISEAVLDRAIRRLPSVEFTQAYGMTELSPIATVLRHEHHVGEGRAKGRHRSGGRATFSVEVEIVDAESRPVPRGTVGEVAVRGDTVMMGYWNQPEATAQAVRNGWMHTGDGAYMDDDGFIYIVDRMKDMIISGGENVYSAEVENAVALHPAVVQCAVIGVPDEQWGEAVHVVVVLRAGASAVPADIIDHCRERIAGYKCPRSVEFRQALPLSGAGKILKTELRKPFWEGRERRVS